MLSGSFHRYCSLFRCVRIYILELHHTNVVFVGRILPNIQVQKHSGAMLKCNGSGKIFTLSWRWKDSIVKWKWTGRGFLEGSEYTRLQNICLSKKPHKSNVHTEALTQKIKSVEHESIYMESRLGQIVNVVYSSPWTIHTVGIMKWFMCVRNCTLERLWKHWRKQYFLKIPPSPNSYWRESLQL